MDNTEAAEVFDWLIQCQNCGEIHVWRWACNDPSHTDPKLSHASWCGGGSWASDTCNAYRPHAPAERVAEWRRQWAAAKGSSEDAAQREGIADALLALAEQLDHEPRPVPDHLGVVDRHASMFVSYEYNSELGGYVWDIEWGPDWRSSQTVAVWDADPLRCLQKAKEYIDTLHANRGSHA